MVLNYIFFSLGIEFCCVPVNCYQLQLFEFKNSPPNLFQSLQDRQFFYLNNQLDHHSTYFGHFHFNFHDHHRHSNLTDHHFDKFVLQ